MPGRNSYFARQRENSYFVQDNSRIVPIPTLRRTYILQVAALCIAVSNAVVEIKTVNLRVVGSNPMACDFLSCYLLFSRQYIFEVSVDQTEKIFQGSIASKHSDIVTFYQ